MANRHGGQVLIDQLSINGCERVFCVPGESYLAALDGLYGQPQIQTVVCRQEGGAAMMAEAYGKLTGRPGVCFVTRGPGATNASAGVHIAQQDSTPMILFIGQIDRGYVDREAFQEVDFRQMFQPLAKWVASIDSAERIPEYISRAYHTAVSGRPGPVVLVLPEDMLAQQVDVADAKSAVAIRNKPGVADIGAVVDILAGATRPIVIVGGGDWSASASYALMAFAERWSLPVVAEFRCQDYIDNHHPSYVGDLGLGINPKLFERVVASDVILCIGARLGEMPSNAYSLLDIPNPGQKFIHIHPSTDELGRVYRPDVGIVATAPAFTAGLQDLALQPRAEWREWTEAGRRDYLAHIVPPAATTSPDLGCIVSWLSTRLSGDAIITNGAGLYTATVQRHYQYGAYRSQLAPIAGSMGYGLPAAIGAKLQQPDKTVVCFAGDGCFLMTGQELATVMQYEVRIIIIVVNNSMYGTIRKHQQREFPGRVVATELRNPDFAAYARSFGLDGQLVTATDAFPAAFERAFVQPTAALIEVQIS
ncbi:MAG: thiamine pyrophosphate-binding protein [Gammaproteobacteria bacterium]|nr:thiamine pyrophosphate-binding protein [Gammaproteobacteria bacterium]MDH3467565.1 thiamine pyrophosphate-binding protein [Gammaproteobacteria bacterium]